MPAGAVGEWLADLFEPTERSAAAASGTSDLVERRTESSRTFRNADGTYTTESFSGPIHFRDSDGVWQQVDNRLIPSERLGYAWRNAANRFDAHFRARSGEDDLAIVVGMNNYTFTLQAAGSERARSSAGSTSGSRTRYASVGPSTDLEYEVTNVGVKEALTLRGPDAPSSFTYLVRGPISAAERQPDGSVQVRDVAGDVAFVIAAPWAAEARSGREREALREGASHASQSVALTAGGFELSVTVDDAWLSAPGRRFPVVVDPTINVTSNTRETYVTTASVDSPTGCCPTSLTVGTDSRVIRTLLRFDQSQIPLSSTVSSASLSLQYEFCVAAPCTDDPAQTIQMHRILQGPWSSWDSGPNIKPTWNWSNVSYDATVVASVNRPAGQNAGIGSPTTHTWSGAALTSLVQQWAKAEIPNDGVLLRLASETLNQGGPAYRSAAWGGATMPKLIVTYTANGSGNGHPADAINPLPVAIETVTSSTSLAMIPKGPFHSLLQSSAGDLLSFEGLESDTIPGCHRINMRTAPPPYSSSSWSTAVDLDTGSACTGAVTMGSNDNVYVVTNEGVAGGVLERWSKSGSIWTGGQVNTVSPIDSTFSIGYSARRTSNARIWVAYRRLDLGVNKLAINYSDDNGATFNPLNVFTFSNDTPGQLVEIPGSAAGLLRLDGTSLKFSTSSSWGSSTTIATSVAAGSAFQSVSDSSGNVHVLYKDSSAGIKYLKRDTGGSWSSASTLPSTSTGESDVSLSLNEQAGSPVQLIMAATSSAGQFWTRSFDGSTWSSPTTLAVPVVRSKQRISLPQAIRKPGVTPYVWWEESGTTKAVQFDYQDAVAPTGQQVSPTAHEVVDGTFTLEATGSDGIGVARIDFFVDRGSGLLSFLGSDTTPDGTGKYTYDWNTTELDGGSRKWPDGAYRVFARIWDYKRNRATSNRPLAYIQLSDFGVRPYRPSLPFEVGAGISGQIDLWNGNLTVSHALVAEPTVLGPIAITRNYNSHDPANGAAGRGWSLGVELEAAINFAKLIDHSADANPLNVVEIVETDGTPHYYLESGGGGYASFVDDFSVLSRNSNSTWTLLLADGGRYTFSSAGDPVDYRPAPTSANQIAYVYTSGRLTSVTDPLSRGFNFTYDGNNRLATVVATQSIPARTWTFGYSTGGELTSVQNPIGGTTTYAYDPTTKRMTSIQTPAGVRYQFAYDTATPPGVTDLKQLNNSSTYTTKVEYLSNPAVDCPSLPGSPKACRRVVSPKGTLATCWSVPACKLAYATTYGLDGRHRTTSVMIRTQPDGIDRTRTLAWNGDNLLTSSSDFKGKITSHTYDGAGNLLTTTGPDPDDGGPLGQPTVQHRFDEPYQGLQAFYFNNTTLTPPATTRRLDSQVDFGWGGGGPAPGVSADNFSVRWIGYIKIDTAGAYTFYTESDDGNRLYVDGELLGDNWNPATPPYSGEKTWGPITLATGLHPVVVEMYDGCCNAEIHLRYSASTTPPVSKQTVPASKLVPGFNLETTRIDEAGITTTLIYEDETPPNYSNDDDAFIGNLIQEETTNTPIGGTAQTFKTRYSYNTYGQRTSKTLPKGMTGGSPDPAYTTTYTYFGDENATNNCTAVSYPQKGLLKSVAQPGLATVTFVHDGQGATVKQNDGKGDTCSTFDALGRVTGVQPPGLGTTSYGYDADGRTTSINDPAITGTATYTYDDLGRLLTARDERGNELSETAGSYTYDENSNNLTRVDKTGTTTYTYDQLDRLIQVKDPANNTYNTSYDQNSQITKQTYPNGTETQRTYDNLQRLDIHKTLTAATGAMLAQNDYERDIRGLIKRDDAPEGLWVYTYDALGRVEQAHDPTIGRTRRYSYDLNSNRTSVKLNSGWNTTKESNTYGSAITDGVPIPGFNGDNACSEQLLTFNFPFAGSSYDRVLISTNGYVKLGSATCDSATSIDLTTTANRIIAPYNRDLNFPATNPTRAIYTEISTTGPKNFRIRWKGEVTGNPSHTANFDLLLFESGLIRFRYGTMPSTGTGRVGTTPGNQLDFVAVAGYDRLVLPTSNADNVTLTPAAETTTETYGYNARDQLTATGSLIAGVAYNSDGDQTSISGPSPRGTVNLTFDGRHLVTGQSTAGLTTSWVLDGEARVTRQTKSLLGTTVYRYNAPGDNPAWEEDTSGTITTSFVTGPLGILATYSSGTPTYLVTNGHGDIIQTRNGAGALIEDYTYNDSGDVTSSAKPTRYGYVGSWQKDREEDSSLIRMGVRMYDPLVTRFVSWDPVDGGDYNAYSYAGQNPCSNYDLDGRKATETSSSDCDALLTKIRKFAGNIARRMTQLLANKRNLPLSGSMSIQGHAQTIRERKGKLRKMLRRWNRECGDARRLSEHILRQADITTVAVYRDGVKVWQADL